MRESHRRSGVLKLSLYSLFGGMHLCPVTTAWDESGAVSHGHLAYYLDEFTLRFNRTTSRSRTKLLYGLVQQVVAVEPVPIICMLKHGVTTTARTREIGDTGDTCIPPISLFFINMTTDEDQAPRPWRWDRPGLECPSEVRLAPSTRPPRPEAPFTGSLPAPDPRRGSGADSQGNWR